MTKSSPLLTPGKRNFRGRLSTATNVGVIPLNLLTLNGFLASSRRSTLAEVAIGEGARVCKLFSGRAGVAGGVKAGAIALAVGESVSANPTSVLSLESEESTFEARLYGERVDVVFLFDEGTVFLLSDGEGVSGGECTVSGAGERVAECESSESIRLRAVN
jgi:hypothetical protein